MPHCIAEPCIGVKDGACAEVCPVECIHPTRQEGDFERVEQLYIDAARCIDCGLCVDECPVNAIFSEDDLPGPWRRFIEINAAYFRK